MPAGQLRCLRPLPLMVKALPGQPQQILILSHPCPKLGGSCASTLRHVSAPSRSASGLVAAVEHVGDLIDALWAGSGIAGGSPQIDAPEAR